MANISVTNCSVCPFYRADYNNFHGICMLAKFNKIRYAIYLWDGVDSLEKFDESQLTNEPPETCPLRDSILTVKLVD